MDNLQLEQVIKTCGSDIFTFFIHLTGDRNRAEELYQDTFLKAVQLDKIDFENNPKSYLLGLGINLWRNKRRKEFFRNRIISFTPLSRQEEIFEIGDGNRPVEDIEQREQNLLVRKAVYRLPDKYKAVVLLHYIEELSVTQTARILKIPEGTVKTRLRTARGILKKELEALL